MIGVWVRVWVRVRARVGVGVRVAVGVWRGEATERIMTPQATRGVNCRRAPPGPRRSPALMLTMTLPLRRRCGGGGGGGGGWGPRACPRLGLRLGSLRHGRAALVPAGWAGVGWELRAG